MSLGQVSPSLKTLQRDKIVIKKVLTPYIQILVVYSSGTRCVNNGTEFGRMAWPGTCWRWRAISPLRLVDELLSLMGGFSFQFVCVCVVPSSDFFL
jgi:hypothetical protein